MTRCSFLHARGGVSQYRGTMAQCPAVFSTHVEVFPRRSARRLLNPGFLHARGGVSKLRAIARKLQKFSPRTWRCFFTPKKTGGSNNVFSTHVEVFLHLHARLMVGGCFLHARGGVSFAARWQFCPAWFSPRTWRCFWRPPVSDYLSPRNPQRGPWRNQKNPPKRVIGFDFTQLTNPSP